MQSCTVRVLSVSPIHQKPEYAPDPAPTRTSSVQGRRHPSRIAENFEAHELAHLHEAHHTPEFWLLLERAMPDSMQRKTWFAEHGIDVEGV